MRYGLPLFIFAIFVVMIGLGLLSPKDSGVPAESSDTKNTKNISGSVPHYSDKDDIPQSVLHYPDASDIGRPREIPCYMDKEYQVFLKEHPGARQKATAVLKNGDTMTIYDSGGNRKNFFVIVQGPDKAGAMEFCEVAAGRNFEITAP